MKNKFYIMLVSLLLSSCCTYSSCVPVKFWDGYYSRISDSKEFDRKEKEFYSKESADKKTLRKQNQKICDDLAEKTFRETKQKYPNKVVNMSDLYTSCMKSRGTPEY